MNLVEQKLSALSIGEPVRLTQTNGQIIEGVLSANDKTEALEVIVTAKVTLMYSQITGIEQNNAFGIGNIPVQSVTTIIRPDNPALEKAETPTKKEKQAKSESQIDIRFICTEHDLRNAFTAMRTEARNKFSSVLNKVTSAIKNHDKSKFKESVEAAWDIIGGTEYEDDPDVNRFYAYVCAFADEYNASAVSFYYSNNMREAYKIAFEGAKNNNDKELFVLASVFSAIYCKDIENEFIDEAVKVIGFSAEKCKDISAIRYLIDLNPTDQLNKLLIESVKYLATAGNILLSAPTNLRQSISEIESFYSSATILQEINSYDNDPDLPEEELPEEDNNTASENIPAVEELKTAEGKITKYNFFEGKGKITDNDGKVYEYELKDIADTKLLNNLKAISKWNDSKTIPVKFEKSRKMGKDYAVKIIRIEVPKAVLKYITKDPNALYMKGDYEEAIEIIEFIHMVLEEEPQKKQLHFILFLIYHYTGDVALADDHFKEFSDTYSCYFDSQTVKGMLLNLGRIKC